MKVSKVLIAARAVIADPKNWTKGSFAKDANGHKRYAIAPEAVCWCALGAVMRVGANDVLFGAACYWLDGAAGTWMGGYNDAHTHAEVLEVFDRAIASAEAS